MEAKHYPHCAFIAHRPRLTLVASVLRCLTGELVSALTCHPEYKLLSVCTIPQMPSSSIAYSTFSWPGLLKHLRQMLISNTKMEEGKFSQKSSVPYSHHSQFSV